MISVTPLSVVPSITSQLQEKMGNLVPSCVRSEEEEDKKGTVIAGRWRVSDKIVGKGSFATVKLGYDTKMKKKVAVRLIPTAEVCPVSLEHLQREAEIHPVLNHEGIVKCYYCKEDEEGILMIQEYVTDGSLLDYYGKKRLLMEFEVRNIFNQVISAVQYMHSSGIVHRDIKADNILIYASTQTIKLADMGFADRFTSDKLFLNYPGTLAYSPPEVLQGRPHYGPPRDVWSLGVLLYILLTGKYPFGSQANSKTKAKILNEEPDYTNPRILPLAKDLICKILCKDPTKRITLDGIKNHPWVSGASSVLFKNTAIRRASSLAGDLIAVHKKEPSTQHTQPAQPNLPSPRGEPEKKVEPPVPLEPTDNDDRCIRG